MVAYTVKIELGDPSGDGHCISENKLFKTNYNQSHLVQAYRVSVAKFGVDLHDVCSNYQDSRIKKDLYDKLLSGGFPINEYFSIEDDYYINDASNFGNMIMEFIKVSLPDLTYETISMEVPSIGSFGYGLYSA